MRHLVPTKKQVPPTLHSQTREKKILNKYALSPCSWTAPTSLELGHGVLENSNREPRIFYRVTLERKPMELLSLIWKWVVSPKTL